MTPHRSPWTSPKVLLTLLLVFLAGAVSGALAHRLGLRARAVRYAPAAAMNRPPAKDAFLEKFKLERLREELHLRPDQVEQVAAVLDDYRGFYQSIQDQMDDMRATGKTRILQALDTDQRAKLEEMLREAR
jgi:hypothetical protein